MTGVNGKGKTEDHQHLLTKRNFIPIKRDMKIKYKQHLFFFSLAN